MSNWIAFGAVGRPHGVRGELTIWPANSASDNRTNLVHFLLSPGANAAQGTVFKIAGSRVMGDHWVVSLDGVISREQAALLTNQTVFVDRAELAPCLEGEIYLADVLGYAVFDQTTQTNVGKFTDVVDYPQGVYMVVKRSELGRQGELELPWVVDFIHHIDDDAKIIYLNMPEGLLELTQWK